MRILITGANGFVGPHLVQSLQTHLPSGTDIRLTSREPSVDGSGRPVEALDITDRSAVEDMIGEYRCTHVINLAGVSAITSASENPFAAWRINLDGTLNIAHALIGKCPDCVLVSVGSGLVYGPSGEQAADEQALLNPTDTYSATKAAADLAVGALARMGLRCIRMRPFNHTGPGQTDAFAIPSFAMQIARIEIGLQAPVIRVGNLSAERDFLDVRDVTSAYALAVSRSCCLANGAVLNIASGVAKSIEHVLERLLGMSPMKISIEIDPGRMRPNDLPRIVGDASTAKQLLGWRPAFTLDQTLSDLLDDCRRRVRG